MNNLTENIYHVCRPTFFPQRPNKLKCKLPLQQKVVDIRNDLFEWFFEDGKLSWRYLGNLSTRIKPRTPVIKGTTEETRINMYNQLPEFIKP